MIKVIIADDQELIRTSLKIILSTHKDIGIVGIAADGFEVLDILKRKEADIVLMDIRMPRMDGVYCTKIIKEQYPSTKVIILTTFNDDDFVFSALKYGASGYLLKDVSMDELYNYIVTVYKGGALINPDIATKVFSMFTDPTHIRIEDPGKLEGNTVFTYLDAFCRPEYFPEFLPEYNDLDELKEHYKRGGLGDMKVKRFLNNVLQSELEPIRKRRKEWQKDIPAVYEILRKGSEKAEKVAADTLKDVKAAMRINYFDDEELIKMQSAKYTEE